MSSPLTQDGGQLLAIYIFFLVLCTVAVGLRLYVRFKLSKNYIGLDDALLTLTYIGFVLVAIFSLLAVHLGLMAFDSQPYYNIDKANYFNGIRNVICFAISGMVRISVALCIYRLLDHRPGLKAIVLADIFLCALTTVVCNLILDLGCTASAVSPFVFNSDLCERTIYSQEACFILFSLFNALFPIWLLWNTRIRPSQKLAVMVIFSLGLLSTIAVVVKFRLIVLFINSAARDDWRGLWAQCVKWGAVEHGISIFAAAIIALRPIFDRLATRFALVSRVVSEYTPHRGSITSLMRRKKSGSAGDSHSQVSDGSRVSTSKHRASCSKSGSFSRANGKPRFNPDDFPKGCDPILPPPVALTPVMEAKHQWDWGDWRPPVRLTCEDDQQTRLRSTSYVYPISPGGGTGGRNDTQHLSADYFGYAPPGTSSGKKSSVANDGMLTIPSCECEPSSRRSSAGRISEAGSVSRNWFDDKRFSCEPDDGDIV